MRLNPCEVRLNIEANIEMNISAGGGGHGPDGQGWEMGARIEGVGRDRGYPISPIWYPISPIWYPIPLSGSGIPSPLSGIPSH